MDPAPFPARRIRWHQRLSFRLALFLVLAMLAFDFVTPRLYDAAFHWFGLPPLDADVWVWETDPTDEELDAPFDGTERSLAGDDDTLALESTDPREHAPADFDEFLEEVPADAVFMNESDIKLEERLQLGLAIFLPLVTTILFALIISRLVTWRVTRLAGQASGPVDVAGELPGPFDERGSDEIAVLAKSMNSMRGQVTGLLAGMRAKDSSHRDWVAQVSHDLRTPLTALLACMDRADAVLAERGDDRLRTELGDVLSIARTDIDRVHALAEDLFEVARLESGPRLECEPIPPGELVRQAVRSLQALAVAQDIELNLELGAKLPTIEGDGRLLLRATENLLRNALQHAKSRIDVTATHAADGLVITVRDDGPGFRAEQLTSERDHSTRNPNARTDSAGLGLLVVRRVAAAHGGQVTIANQEEDGNGACVTLTLPTTENQS